MFLFVLFRVFRGQNLSCLSLRLTVCSSQFGITAAAATEKT